MLLSLALLAGLAQAAPQDPAPDPARARFEAAAAQWRKAAAVDVAFHYTAEFSAQDDTQADAQALVISGDCEIRLARPLLGTVKTTQDGASVSYLADGAKVYWVDDAARRCQELGAALTDLPFVRDFVPLRVWADPKAPAPVSVELLEDPARPGAQGLKLQLAHGSQTVWLDPHNQVLAATWIEGEESPPIELRFSRWSTPEAVDLALYQAKLPEGYAVVKQEPLDFDYGLLAVGSAAPEVRMTDLDGKSFALSDLRGRTILLNFWFRH